MRLAARTPWTWLAVLPAILVGATIARLDAGVTGVFAPNVLALLLGAALLVAARRAAPAGLAAVLPLVAAAAIAATLLAPGLAGVHRWLPLGPLRVAVSAAVAPWLLLGLASRERGTWRRAALAAALVQGVHLAQPDAGQATALALAALPLAARRAKPDPGAVPPAPAERVALAALLVLLAALTWRRPDPLAPVAYVERILFLAAGHGPGAIALVVAAAVLLVVPLLARDRAVAAALVAYLGGAFLVTFLGSFPVPVLGAGAGPVLGWFALRGVRESADAE